MDSSTSTPLASKVYRCHCGRRMSSQTYDFHSICMVCRGVDYENDTRCLQCNEVDDATFDVYLKHKLSLQRKLVSKRKSKALASTPVVDLDVAASVPPSDRSLSPVTPLVPEDPPMSSDSSSLEQVKGDILPQVKGLFDSFAGSLEARFTSIDNKVSEVASSRDLPIALVAHRSEPDRIRDVSVQDDNSNTSFSAPILVAGGSEPAPDGVPSPPYPDGLGAYPGGPLLPTHVRVLLPSPTFLSWNC